MILRPTQKIEVVESNRQCKTGSIGYFVCQDSMLNYNAWQMVSIFTRYGKKGKRRISLLGFSTRMFTSDQLKESDRKILDTVQAVEGLLPRLNSNKRRAHRFESIDTQEIGASTIIPTDIECKNLLDLDTWDFLGYFTALSLYLNRLRHGKLSYQLASVPLLLGLNEFIEHKDPRLMSPEYMGYYVIRGLEIDVETKSKLFETSYLSLFDNQAMRKECLDKIIMSMVIVKDRDAHYKSQVARVYKDIEIRINGVLSYYRKKKNDLKYVQKGEEEYKDNPSGSLPVSPRQQEALNKLASTKKKGTSYQSKYYPRREE